MGIIADDDDLNFGDTEVQEHDNTDEQTVTTEVTEPVEGDTEQAELSEEEAAQQAAQREAEAKAAEKEAKAKELAEAREVALKDFFDKVETESTDQGERRDVSTGTLSAEQVAEIVTEYAKLDLPGKNAAKKQLTEKLTAVLMESPGDTDLVLKARSYGQVLTELNKVAATNKRETVAKEPVDPTVAFVERAASLYLAVSLVTPPKGVSADWSDKVTELAGSLQGDVEKYRAWTIADPETRGDAPQVSPIVLAAAKVAEGRPVKKARATGGSGSSTPRAPREGGAPSRNVAKHIANAFRDKEVGTIMTVSEIVNVRSEEYGDDKPSAGAISARMWKGSDLDNRLGAWVEGVEASDGQPKRFKLAGEIPADLLS